MFIIAKIILTAYVGASIGMIPAQMYEKGYRAGISANE